MAKITSIQVGFYRIPLENPVADAMRSNIVAYELNTVRIRDEDGAEGVGYTYTGGHNGAAIDATLRRDVPQLIIGEDADCIERLWNKIWWAQHYGGRGGAAVLAQSAIDIALWDLKAKRLGQPLWKLLGGYDPKVPCYASGIDLRLTLDQLLKQTEENVAKGYRAIKMKVGSDRLSEDVERVRAMRDLLGSDIRLMVDANMKWSVDDAIRAARALQPFDLFWLEEPVIPDDVQGQVRVAREGGLPVAAGENMRTIWEFKQLMTAGGVTFPEPDVTTCGGVTSFMKIAHLAEAHNLPITSHGAQDATVHLLAAAPNRAYVEIHAYTIDRFVEYPLVIENGYAIAPDRPGHGIVFDWAALDRVAA